MLLSIVTPQKKLIVDKEIEEVIVPASKGELTILTGHAPLITTLGIGILQFKEKSDTSFQRYAISWGYCEIAGDVIKILAETAESAEMIDKERAKKTLDKSQNILINNTELSAEDTNKHMNKVKKAQVRLEL